MEVELKDICEFQEGYVNPPQTKHEYFDGNIKWIRATDINSTYIYDTSRTLTDAGFKSAGKSAKLFEPNSLIISKSGTIGKLGIIKDYMCGNRAVINIKPDLSKVNLMYLYYSIKMKLPYIKELARGSVQKNLYIFMLDKVKIFLPSLEQQQKMINELEKIDKKIELNNEINNNLHELCNNMYFELLSQLDDSNSSSKQIKEVSKCALGGTPSRAKSEYWDGNINWINSGEVNKFRIIDASEKITELGLQKSSTTLLPKGTTVLAITGATLGQVSRLEIDSCANQSVIGIIPNNKELNNYIYLSILNTINDLILKQTGGAQQHINKNDVETHELIIPNDKLLKEFDERTKSIFKKISITCFENKRLEQLRDTLLPKLMNGEIDLDNIEI